MPRCLYTVTIATGLLLAVGCGGRGTAKPDASASGGQTAASSGVSSKERRETIVGRWILFLNRQLQVVPFALLEVRPDADGAFEASILEITDTDQHPESTTLTTDADAIEITFVWPDGEIHFLGTFADGQVRGNLMLPGGLCELAWLTATTADSLDDQAVVPLPDAALYGAVSDAIDVQNQIRAFVQSHSDSPIALIGYLRLVNNAARENLSEDQLRNLIAEFESAAGRWGQRRAAKALLDSAISLTQQDYAHALILDLVDQARTQLEQRTETWEPIFTSLGASARMAVAIHLARGDDPQQRDAAASELRKMIADEPINPVALLALANYSRRNGNTDEALDLYAQVSVLPGSEQGIAANIETITGGTELPGRSLASLWEDKHGSTDGLEDFLDGVYRRILEADAVEPPTLRDSGNRVACFELFTGSHCLQCVAADLATLRLASVFPRSEVIVLRYHEHQFGPDPLANSENEDRFKYYLYEGASTPSLFLNGRILKGIEGIVVQTGQLTQALREWIQPIFEEETPVSLAVAAQRNGNTINIDTTVTGVPADLQTVRLRLALAETEVRYVAHNGIRYHGMVVRTMPGGVDGIEVENGSATFQGVVHIAELKERLNSDLDEVELAGQIRFDERPQGLATLELVALVQNDDTREILQAAAVAVQGGPGN